MDEFRVVPRVGSFHLLLVELEKVVLGPIHFGVAEAVQLHLLDFGHEGLECADAFPVPAGDVAHHNLTCLAQVAYSESCVQERSIRAGSNVAEPFAHDEAYQALYEIQGEAHVCAVKLFRHRLAFPYHFQCRRGGLGVGDYTDKRLFIARDLVYFLRLGVFLILASIWSTSMSPTTMTAWRSGRYQVW